MATKRWTPEACSDLLKQRNAGARLCELSREHGVSVERVRTILTKAKFFESQNSYRFRLLSARTRNALSAAGLVTVDEIRGAFVSGVIKNVTGIGPVSVREVQQWLLEVSATL